jgi:hypothetical protein
MLVHENYNNCNLENLYQYLSLTMPKQPSIKINDHIRRHTDNNKVYIGTYIKLTEKGIRCKWDDIYTSQAI